MEKLAKNEIDQTVVTIQNMNEDPGSLRTSIKMTLRLALAERLRIPPEMIDYQVPITRYGIDSLGAVEIAHTIEKKCNVSVSYETLLEGLTIEEISARTSSEVPNPITVYQPSQLNQDNEGQDWQLSLGQEALWHIYRQMPLSSAYNVATAMRIHSPVDLNRLQARLDILVARHPLLRATFTQSDGRVVQHINLERTTAFESEESVGWTEEKIKARLSEELRRPFNLQSGPLLRMHIWKYSESDYLLLIVTHHIIADLWSLSMLLTELFSLYGSEDSLILLPIPTQYDAYVEWQRRVLNSAQGAEHWQYWEHQLQDSATILDIPTDHPRPEIRSFYGDSIVGILDEETTRGIKELSKKYDLTLNVMLLAIYQILLHRYTFQDVVIVGSTLAGRSRPQWAGIFGYFVNSLPLVARFSSQITFNEFAKQIQRIVIGALDHQDYPLSTLVERLNPLRIPGRTPLFDSLFVFQHVPFWGLPKLAAFALGIGGARVSVGGLDIESVSIERQSTTFDLTFMVGDLDGQIGISIKFATDLFESTTIHRMLTHFQTVARATIENPFASVQSLPLMTKSEQQMILIEWNSGHSETTSVESNGACVSELFDKQARSIPNNYALVFENDSLTYAQLQTYVNQVAFYLKRVGIGPEMLVAVYLERGIELVVAILGILKAGATYVPFDPSEPTARATAMLQMVQPHLVLTQGNLAERLIGNYPSGLYVDIANCINEDFSESGLAVRHPEYSESAAYIIFTSGSTGAPRGVCVERRQLLNYVQEISKRINGFVGARYATVSTIAADLGNTMVFTALCTGGCLHVLSNNRALSPSALGQYFSERSIDFLKIVPSHIETLLRGNNSAGVLPRKCIILGGEKCDWSLVAKIRDYAPDCRILNHYGPTETTIGVLTHEVTAGTVKTDSSVIPIGRPIGNVQAYVLDDEMQPVPVGVRGNLYIGGDAVSRGYYNSPADTAEKFLPDCFSLQPGRRLYRTGDIALYRANGIIEFHGRRDQQIKLRGFRIELGEIEAALKRHPAVQQVAVIQSTRGNMGQHLAAYVVCSCELQSLDMRRFAREQLPEYMVPSSISIVERLPLTANGKLDHDALREITPEHSQDKIIAEASTPLERALVMIWQKLLGVQTIGVNDDFFELGGHSLMATQMTSQLEEILPSETPLLVQFFQTPTVAGLAEAMLRDLTGAEEIAKAVQLIENVDFSDQI